MLPYGFRKNKDGSWCMFNRNYLMIGFNFCFKRMNKKLMNSIAHTINKEYTEFWLYSDDCIPTRSKENMNQYLNKLARLMRYSIKK